MLRALGALILLLLASTTLPSGAPAAGSAEELKALCEGTMKGEQVAPGALASTLQRIVGRTPPNRLDSVLSESTRQVPYCFRYSHSLEGEPLLAATLVGADQGALLWFADGEWKAAATIGMAEHPNILHQADRPTGREAWIAAYSTGTGGLGFLVLFRQQGDSWQIVARSQIYSHFQPRVLDSDHIVVTGRNVGDEPFAWTANCCLPVNYQWLWQRRDEGFAVAGERLAPDPYYTLNLFFGALQQNRADWLVRAATPEAVAAVRRAIPDAAGIQTSTPRTGPEFGEVTEAELAHWTLLPDVLSGPPPVHSVLTAEIEILEGPTLTVEVSRFGGRWWVTSVK